MKRLGNLLTTLLSVAALGLTGCADSEEAVVEVSAPPAPVVPETRSEPIAYVEYLQCKFGPNYSAESFGPYLAAWNAEVDGMTDRNLSAFGYLPNEWSSDVFDGVWVLRWNDKESRDAGWKEYAESGGRRPFARTTPWNNRMWAKRRTRSVRFQCLFSEVANETLDTAESSLCSDHAVLLDDRGQTADRSQGSCNR